MEGKGNRGAYAQVTAPLEDDSKVTIEPGAKSQGMCASCTLKRLIIIAVVLVVVIVIAIVIAVAVIKNNKSAQSVQGTTVAPTPTVSHAQEMATTTMSNSSLSMGEMLTTPAPPPPTTFGPAVAGSFRGTLVMDRPYDTAFDDNRATLTTDLKANITAAMDLVFSDPAAPYLYHSTVVDQFLQNGTNVQVEFTVLLDAINKGGSAYLVKTIGATPSKVMATYPVLYVAIQPEEKTPLDA